MSLIISLTCALLATFLQQWARKYIRVTQPHYGPHKRVRVHAIFFRMSRDASPASPSAGTSSIAYPLTSFLVPLPHRRCVPIPLQSHNLQTSPAMARICAVLYGCIAFMSIHRHDSAYSTPLSSSVWFIANGIIFVIHRAFRWPMGFQNNETFEELKERYRRSPLQGMRKSVVRAAQNSSSKVDAF